MTFTPEQIEAGARALTDHIYGPGAWENCAPEIQQINCQAFAAGVATLTDHTAELLEAIDKMREIDRLKGRLDWYAEHGPAETHDKLCKQLDTLEAQIATAIANARAQTKGGATP